MFKELTFARVTAAGARAADFWRRENARFETAVGRDAAAKVPTFLRDLGVLRAAIVDLVVWMRGINTTRPKIV
jgi:hypothetical protein